MKKLMILGSAKYFESLVETAKNHGIYTIVCDNRADGPAKRICDEAINIDVMDYEKLKQVAIEKEIDGILTGFSDALLYPYAYVAEELALPCVIKPEQVEYVVNKEKMKQIFEEFNIPSPKYVVIDSEEELKKLDQLEFPLVMKPLDSSSSRGIYFVNNYEEIWENLLECKSYSSDNRVIFEELYESDEIQGLSWVHEGQAHVMYLGDRDLVNIHEGRPGKPERLIYPSKYCYQYEEIINRIFQSIATAFKIENGPMYVQLLVGSSGVKVSEMMTRLPGGCDYLTVKQVTGYDAGKLNIDFAVGNLIDFTEVQKNTMHLNKIPFALPIYVKSGKINKINNIDKIEELPYVTQYMQNVKEGDVIQKVGDERQDSGRIHAIANNFFDAEKKKHILQSMVSITDENDRSMVENF